MEICNNNMAQVDEMLPLERPDVAYATIMFRYMCQQ